LRTFVGWTDVFELVEVGIEVLPAPLVGATGQIFATGLFGWSLCGKDTGTDHPIDQDGDHEQENNLETSHKTHRL